MGYLYQGFYVSRAWRSWNKVQGGSRTSRRHHPGWSICRNDSSCRGRGHCEGRRSVPSTHGSPGCIQCICHYLTLFVCTVLFFLATESGSWLVLKRSLLSPSFCLCFGPLLATFDHFWPAVFSQGTLVAQLVYCEPVPVGDHIFRSFPLFSAAWICLAGSGKRHSRRCGRGTCEVSGGLWIIVDILWHTMTYLYPDIFWGIVEGKNEKCLTILDFWTLWTLEGF